MEKDPKALEPYVALAQGPNGSTVYVGLAGSRLSDKGFTSSYFGELVVVHDPVTCDYRAIRGEASSVKANMEPVNTVNTLEAYQAAIKAAQVADDRLSALLQAKYGDRAGDMRYRYLPTESTEIDQAKQVYLDASQARHIAWLALVKATTVTLR